jgi:hypothetical protein
MAAGARDFECRALGRGERRMSTAQEFRNCLIAAKDHFETARSRLPRGLMPGDELLAAITAGKALLESMLRDCARAYEIARDAPEAVSALGVDAASFTSFMQPIAETTSGEETSAAPSLKYEGPDEIYIGALNVVLIYDFVVATLRQCEDRSAAR